MRVFVMGATGFIGTRVVEDLIIRKGDDARVVVRNYRRAVRLGRLSIEWVEAAAFVPSAMSASAAGCDAVVCCAHPFGAPNEADAALEICRGAIAAAAVTTSKRLVFVSSTAIYGSGGGDVLDRTPPKPDTDYGRTKVRCEELLNSAHNDGTIRLAIVRPSIVYGPFSPSWTALPARTMRAGDLILPTHASGFCNAVYIDDVAMALSEAVHSTAVDPIAVNVNGPDRMTWREFYRPFETAIRPGSVIEWDLAQIEAAQALRLEDQGSWPALKRTIRDPAVRNRLNEIPALSRLNTLAKSVGWTALPPVSSTAPALAPANRTFEPQLPNPLMIDLYLKAPYVDGSGAASVLRLAPRSFQAGMVPTVEWLRWAGLAAPAARPRVASSADRVS